MKSVSLTEARRSLADLVAEPQTVEVTRRGRPVGTLRVLGQTEPDRERAMEAARGLRELAERVKATIKPSVKHGATRAVRELRDHGDE